MRREMTLGEDPERLDAEVPSERVERAFAQAWPDPELAATGWRRQFQTQLAVRRKYAIESQVDPP